MPSSRDPPEAESKGIIQSTTSRTWWGFPNYERDHEFGLRSWEELSREHGTLGNICELETQRRQCGAAFVCKKGICMECSVSRDCSEHHTCEMGRYGRRVCTPRDLKSQWHWREVLGTLLIVVTAMLSAAAGMGGGGVYVPISVLLLGLSAQEAVPLSQSMIVGGALVNVLMFCGDRHPKTPHRPKIDYDIVMMLNPGLAAGVTVGVIANVLSPQWLIVGTLLVTLAVALQKSLSKGIAQWRKESATAASRQDGGGPSASQSRALQIKGVDMDSCRQLLGSNVEPCSLIAACWLSFFLLNLVRPRPCSVTYWVRIAAQLLVCAMFTIFGSKVIAHRAEQAALNCGGEKHPEGVLQWTSRTLWLYPALSTAAGFLGGFLGIGGGIIMNPVLLELGVLPEVNQATTAMFVFLSSSLATVQFVVLGRAMPQFVVWFSMWVVVATIVGQTLIDHALQRWRRSSLIVLSVAAIIASSLAMMTITGSIEVVSDIQRGADMGFRPHRLCG